MEPATKKARRRVPDDLRQRASVSCDRCKTRKIRCIRLGEPNDPCAACAQQRLDCTASLPRKQRIYASYDQLRSRYCALDMLVKRLFPEEKIDTVEEITDLARRHGIDLIGFEENKGALNPLEEEDETTILSAVPGKDDRLYDSVQQLHIPEGSLIPAPKGGFHYVGPASSYVFANTIRQLVKKSSAYHLAFDKTGYRRQQRAAEFTSSNRTTALEARIQGHPVTTAEDEETPNSDVFHTDGQSPMDRATPRSIPRSITRWTIDLLPTRPLSDKLVTAFFDRVHPNFTLFHRSAFQDQYEDVWKKKSTSEALDPGWLCVLYMIYVLGAQSLERDGLADAMTTQSRYLAMVVRDGLQRLVLTATQSNVQALALLSLYQHNAGERNTAWMLIGHASRMAIGLGMQRDGETSNYTFNIRNLRRLIWWTLYLFEQTLSFVLGRPSATSTVDISAHLPDETILDGLSAPLGYLEHAVKLGAISAKVKRFIASVSTDYDKAEILAKTADMANQLDQILVEWECSLPLHLKADSHFATQKHARAVLLLHATHNHIRSVNGRPYLLCQTNRDLDNRASISPPTILNDNIGTLARTSTTAARSCMELLIRLANLGQLEGELWYDFYYVHHASLILSLPFLAKPNDSTFQMDRATISTALNLAQRVKLAPTYRILINVSIQFAKIVGIGPEDDPSRPPSPFLGSLPSHRPSQASLNDLSEIWTLSTGAGTEESFNNPQTTLSNDSDYTAQQTSSWASMIPGDVAGRENANPHPWSLIPILDPNLTTQPLSLEQLLGLPQSNVTDTIPPLDMTFSDLHNFGLGASLSGDGSEGWAAAGTSRQDWAGMDMGNFPWDFFGGAISPDEVRPRNQ